jgi:hypothetical protein
VFIDTELAVLFEVTQTITGLHSHGDPLTSFLFIVFILGSG